MCNLSGWENASLTHSWLEVCRLCDAIPTAVDSEWTCVRCWPHAGAKEWRRTIPNRFRFCIPQYYQMHVVVAADYRRRCRLSHCRVLCCADSCAQLRVGLGMSSFPHHVIRAFPRTLRSRESQCQPQYTDTSHTRHPLFPPCSHSSRYVRKVPQLRHSTSLSTPLLYLPDPTSCISISPAGMGGHGMLDMVWT